MVFIPQLKDTCQVDMRQGVTLFHGTPSSTTRNRGKKKRGKIHAFSNKSRNRMRIALFSLNSKPYHFITLTYPKDWPADSTEWKRHLDNFSKSVARFFPGSWFYWKLEPQRRGAPHYHLLGTIRFQGRLTEDAFKIWLSTTWYNVVGSLDHKHLLAGTQYKIIKDSFKQINHYVSKYLGKAIESVDWENPGRFWGRVGDIPSSPSLVVDLDQFQFVQVRRLIRRWMRSHKHKGTIRYTKKLAYLTSFHVVIPWQLSVQIIQFVLNSEQPPPF